MHKYFQNMFLYCGLAVNNSVHKQLITTHSFTHKPTAPAQPISIKCLYTFLAHFTHQVLHTFFIQFSSVNGLLYAQSTGPTITTTLINK